jgi:hypothetical protein
MPPRLLRKAPGLAQVSVTPWVSLYEAEARVLVPFDGNQSHFYNFHGENSRWMPHIGLPCKFPLRGSHFHLRGVLRGHGSSVAKFDFWGKIQKSGIRNSTIYRLPNSRKSNFATEPPNARKNKGALVSPNRSWVKSVRMITGISPCGGWANNPNLSMCAFVSDSTVRLSQERLGVCWSQRQCA